MWDDMFEYYRDILTKVPRDVIMVNWQYAYDVQHYQGHFLNLKTEHILAEYDRLGFEYIIAPSDYSSANVRTFTEYAENFSPLGGLVTTWEKSTCFLYKSMPTIAYAGRLWSNETEKPDGKSFADAMENIFGFCDDKLLAALRFNTEKELDNEFQVTLAVLLVKNYHGYNYASYESLNLLKSNLEELLSKVKLESGKVILKDIIDACYYNILKCRLRKSAQELFDPLKNTVKAESKIAEIYNDVKTFGKIRIQKWEKYRSGITPCHLATLYKEYLKLIKSLPKLAKNNGILRVRFCLPDSFSMAYCKIALKYSGNWHETFEGCCKAYSGEDAIFEKAFLIPNDVVPEAFRLEVCGYGGQGLTFVELFNETGHYIPSKTIMTSGKVIDAEHVLDNDCKWAFLGEKNSFKAFQSRKLADELHSVEYSLVKV
jgi:hypothetical protein